MVRNRKRKSEKGKTPHDVMKKAVKKVLDGAGIRSTAKEYGTSRSALQRYVKKARAEGIDIRYTPNYSNGRVFTPAEETSLCDYLITCSKFHHGLTTTSTKILAYEYARRLQKKIPKNWDENCSAGEDWLYHFMQRNPVLAIRTPEATSLSRATSFNKKNVTDFYNNLEGALEMGKFTPDSTYNVDETGLTTVHRPPKIIAAKGAKQVGQVTSAERGTLVTACCAINAVGNSIPPFLIFPRVHFKDFMINGAPPGTKGVAHPSGWMSTDIFDQWLDHFIQQTRCSIHRPVLLLMDNHQSHVSIATICKAKDNGITLLTFPPHCSHKLQPLDLTVYGPLKRYFNRSSDAWQLDNPGKTMSIYDIAGILGQSYPRAFTPENITAGFKAAGIYPFDRDVFKDEDFMASYVTDRSNPESGVSKYLDTINCSILPLFCVK